MSETLLTCSGCGTSNFTARGLKAHRCKGTANQSASANLQSTISWDSARLYLTAVRETGRRFLAAQICLGWELSDIKQKLGFTGSGRRPESGHGDHFKSWPEWVASELDVSRETADRFIRVYEGFQAKLSKKLLHGVQVASDNAESSDLPSTIHDLPSLLQTLCKPPETLSTKDRKAVEKAIATAADGDTQKALLEELRLVKVHVPTKGGKVEKKKETTEDEKAGQLAFIFFDQWHQALSQRHVNRDYQALLHTLPPISSTEDELSLTTLERELEDALEDVRSAKAKKLQPAIEA
ncbi:hypothetical protein [Haloferula sargassicola]|uniref:Uncharacterized protein n=1 Tax=Haloferula sargassicola TaxID=490096 RepID=A0ABP9UP23_9BACT